MKLRHRLLGTLAGVAIGRPRTVCAISGLVAIVAVGVILLTGLGVETSRVALWPDDHPLQKRFREYQDLFGSPFQLVIVVEGDDPARNKQAADRIAARVRAEVPTIRDVFFHVDLRAMNELMLLYVPTADLAQMAARAQEFLASRKDGAPRESVALAGVNGAVARLNDFLGQIEEGETAGLSVLEKNIDQVADIGGAALDEVGRWVAEPGRRELAFVEDAGKELGTAEGMDAEGYLVADGGRMVLLLCQPAKEDDRLAYLDSFVRPVRGIVADVERDVGGVRIGVTGMPAFVTEELTVANHDLRFVTLLSAVGVLLLFLVGYGSLLNTVFIALTLMLGVLADLAITALAIGNVNLISSLFVAVLLGLGIDYGIQLINRFQEELREGRTPAEAVEAAVVRSGEGVLTGGVTTAVAFFTMAFGDFKPLRELGIIAGAGILLILAASFVLLPALLVLRGSREARWARSGGEGLLHGGWHLPVLPIRGRRASVVVTVVAALATILLALPIRPIAFSNDLISMLPANAPSVAWLRELEATGMFTSAFNASIAGSLDEVRERTDAFAKLDTTSRIQSVTTFLPEDQDAKAPLVRTIRAAGRKLPELRFDTPPVDVARLLAQLDLLEEYLALDLPLTLKTQGLEQHAPRIQALSVRVKALRAAIAALPAGEAQARLGRLQARMSTVVADLMAFLASDRERVRPEDLPPAVAGLFFKETPAGLRYLIRVYPSGDINDDTFMPRFLEQSRSVDPDVTGYPVNYYEFALVMQDNFRVAFLYAVVAIILLLALDLRRARDVVLALVPLTMGGVWMVGAMNLLDIEYNLANIMAIPLIVGIGVAYGVYVIHRVREETPPRPRSVVQTTGKAVVFSALTTMVSFGAMSAASHRGAAGLGLTLLLGIGFCLVSSVGFLPAMLRLVPPPRRGRSDDSE